MAPRDPRRHPHRCAFGDGRALAGGRRHPDARAGLAVEVEAVEKLHAAVDGAEDGDGSGLDGRPDARRRLRGEGAEAVDTHAAVERERSARHASVGEGVELDGAGVGDGARAAGGLFLVARRVAGGEHARAPPRHPAAMHRGALGRQARADVEEVVAVAERVETRRERARTAAGLDRREQRVREIVLAEARVVATHPGAERGAPRPVGAGVGEAAHRASPRAARLDGHRHRTRIGARDGQDALGGALRAVVARVDAEGDLAAEGRAVDADVPVGERRPDRERRHDAAPERTAVERRARHRRRLAPGVEAGAQEGVAPRKRHPPDERRPPGDEDGHARNASPAADRAADGAADGCAGGDAAGGGARLPAVGGAAARGEGERARGRTGEARRGGVVVEGDGVEGVGVEGVVEAEEVRRVVDGHAVEEHLEAVGAQAAHARPLGERRPDADRRERFERPPHARLGGAGRTPPRRHGGERGVERRIEPPPDDDRLGARHGHRREGDVEPRRPRRDCPRGGAVADRRDLDPRATRWEGGVEEAVGTGGDAFQGAVFGPRHARKRHARPRCRVAHPPGEGHPNRRVGARRIRPGLHEQHLVATHVDAHALGRERAGEGGEEGRAAGGAERDGAAVEDRVAREDAQPGAALGIGGDAAQRDGIVGEDDALRLGARRLDWLRVRGCGGEAAHHPHPHAQRHTQRSGARAGTDSGRTAHGKGGGKRASVRDAAGVSGCARSGRPRRRHPARTARRGHRRRHRAARARPCRGRSTGCR